MAPFSPGCAVAGSSEGTLLLGLFFFFPRGRVLPGELPINYVHGKWDLKAAGINN